MLRWKVSSTMANSKSYNWLNFRLNGNDVASFYDQNHEENHRSSMVGQSLLLNLKIGDQIQVSYINL